MLFNDDVPKLVCVRMRDGFGWVAFSLATRMSRLPQRHDKNSCWRRALQRSPFQPYTGADAPPPVDLGTSDGSSFSGTQAAHIVGVTYRQLDYWARTDLTRPSLADAEGSGSRRRYSYDDLLELKPIKKLLDAGIKLQQVRRVAEHLRILDGPDLSTAHVVIDGESVSLYGDGQLIDVLRAGQGVLHVLSFGGVKSELDDDIAPVVAPAGHKPA